MKESPKPQSAFLCKCPNCYRTLHIYAGNSEHGYFRFGSKIDHCTCCGCRIRLMTDGSITRASWIDVPAVEFQVPVVQWDEDEDSQRSA